MGPPPSLNRVMAADTGVIWKTEQGGETPGMEGGTEARGLHLDLRPPLRDAPHPPGCGRNRLCPAHS